MVTFNIIKNAKKEAGKYAAFWQIDAPMFKSEKYGITEQWSIEQHHGLKAEGSFSLIAA